MQYIGLCYETQVLTVILFSAIILNMKTKLQTVHDRVIQKRIQYEQMRDKAHAETNYSLATCYEQMAVGLLIAEGIFLQFDKEERHAKAAKRQQK